jgi:hypothetical protein
VHRRQNTASQAPTLNRSVSRVASGITDERGSIVRWIVAVSMVASLVWPAAVPQETAAAPATQVSVTVRGVTLSLFVPRRTYPRNALVRMTVRVKNGSRDSMTVQSSACRADGPSPAVRVLDAHGRVVFPPALPEPPLGDFPCPVPPPPLLLPGHVATRQFYVILRANRVRAVVTSDVDGELKTPLVPIRLLSAPSPHLRLSTSPWLHADVVGATGRGKGRLYYTDWYTCVTKYGTRAAGQQFTVSLPGETGGVLPTLTGLVMDWTRVSGTRIRPGCPHPLQWHVAAGWLGQPIASLTYQKQ